MRALLPCSSWVDIIEITLYVLFWAKINDDDDDKPRQEAGHKQYKKTTQPIIV